MNRVCSMIICLIIIISFCGCSTTSQPMETSQITPGASALVTTRDAPDHNTKLIVSVKHLAPANLVIEGTTNYVVWVEPAGTYNFKNVGAFQVDRDLEGKYSTVVPYKKFRVIITPEIGNLADAPTGPTIFEQTVIRQ